MLDPSPPAPVREIYDAMFAPLLFGPLSLLAPLITNTWTLCRVLSAMQGALSFSAVALGVIALTRSPTAAMLFPGFYVPMSLSWLGHNYQMHFLPTAAAAGNIAFYLTLGTVGLLVLDKLRIAGVLLGLLPLFHPTLGLLGWLLAACLIAARGREWRVAAKTLVPWWAPCATVSMVLLARNGIGSAPLSDQGRRALESFMDLWCNHRRPLDRGALVQDILMMMLLAGIAHRARGLPEDHRLRIWAIGLLLFLAALIPYLFVFQTLHPEWAPLILRRMLLNRWANITCVLLPLTLYGWLWLRSTRDRDPASTVGLAFFAALCSLSSYRAMALVNSALGTLGVPKLPTPQATTAVAIALGWMALVELARSFARTRAVSTRISNELSAAATKPGEKCGLGGRAQTITLGIAIALIAWPTLRLAGRIKLNPEAPPMLSRVLPESALVQGVILSPGHCLEFAIPLKKPILCVVHDALPYVPHSIDVHERLLRDIYGLEIKNPLAPQRWKFPDIHRKALWESRDTQDWTALAEQWEFHNVIVPRGWSMRLPGPALDVGPDFQLYPIR